MAIYIKDVELPDNCLACPFTEKDDRMGTVCYFTNIAALNIGRQKDCPLVYIPETQYQTSVNPVQSFGSNACQSCSNNPSNGGSGICHCILGTPTIY